MGLRDALRRFGGWIKGKVKKLYTYYRPSPFAPEWEIEESIGPLANYLEEKFGHDNYLAFLSGNFNQVLQNQQNAQDLLGKMKEAIYEVYTSLANDAGARDIDSALEAARRYVSYNKSSGLLGKRLKYAALAVSFGILSYALPIAAPVFGIASGYYSIARLLFPFIGYKIENSFGIPTKQQLFNALQFLVNRYEKLESSYNSLYNP